MLSHRCRKGEKTDRPKTKLQQAVVDKFLNFVFSYNGVLVRRYSKNNHQHKIFGRFRRESLARGTQTVVVGSSAKTYRMLYYA